MSIPGLNFFVFLALVAVLYNCFEALTWRRSVLGLANLIFLASLTTSPAAWIPYFAFLTSGFVSVVLVRGYRRTWLFVLLLSLNILLFAWLKRYAFVPESSFLHFAYVTLGMSYVCFRILHLIVDTWQGDIEKRIGLLDYFNYTLNFTCIVSGPIQRFEDYRATQLQLSRPWLGIPAIAVALERIIVGVFKVYLLGLIFAEVQKRALESLQSAGSHSAEERVLLASAAIGIYPLFLFCNFSGYTDVVIGAATLYRLRLPENFNRPFSATSFLDFWSRWHMTLSNWLKMYVYTPLLKTLIARVDNPSWHPYLGVLAFFVTFYLIGMWHGQNASYAFYGVLLGVGVSVNKLYQIFLVKRIGKKRYRALSDNRLYNTFCRGVTFTFFSISLVWFWANWTQIRTAYQALGGFTVTFAITCIFLCSTVLLEAWEVLRSGLLNLSVHRFTIFSSRYARTVYATAAIVFTLVVLEAISIPAPDVVYKAF